MSIQIVSLLAGISLLSSSFIASASESLSDNAEVSEQVSDTLPNFVARRIRQDLAERLNVPVQDLVVENATPQVWHDHCLELAGPDEDCVQGSKRGWRVEIESPLQAWVYRSDRTATQLRLESLFNSEQIDFSAAVSQTLLETVSAQVQYPAESLQLLQVKAVTWDSCLGAAIPGVDCVPSAIPGFRVLVTEAVNDAIGTPYSITQGRGGRVFRREWVYHLSADAEQVIYNATASDQRGRVGVFLEDSSDYMLEPLDEAVIFQMNDDLYADRDDVKITLVANGELIYEYYNNVSSEEETVLETRSQQISLERVAFFQTLLSQQNFSDFSGVGYGKEDRYTGIGSLVTLRTQNAVVRTTALGEDLPVNLQIVLSAWSDLVNYEAVAF